VSVLTTSSVRVGDTVRLEKWGEVIHEGVVTDVSYTLKFGACVAIKECTQDHGDEDPRHDTIYLNDYYEVALVGMHTCSTCGGRGIVKDEV